MRFKAATAKLQLALNLDPGFMKGYDNLGLTNEALGQYDDAISIYQKAISWNRSSPSPSPWHPLYLAAMLVRLGRLSEARAYLEIFLRYDPRFPKAHSQFGLLSGKEKKDEEALRDLDQAAQSDPSYPEPHYLLGKISQRIG